MPNQIALSQIQAVLFDLDGTLRFNQPSSTQVFYDYAMQLGVADGGERRRRAMRWTHWYWAQSPDLLRDKQTYPEPERFWLNYAGRALQAIDCPAEQADSLAPEMHRYMNEEHRPQPCITGDTLFTLEQLRQRGLQLGVVSNREQPLQEELLSLGLLDYFDLVLAAGEVGWWKPDPEIFQHALGHLGIPAGRTAYVGDNYYADIVGASRAGLQPILLDPDELFEEADCPVITAIGQILDLLPPA